MAPDSAVKQVDKSAKTKGAKDKSLRHSDPPKSFQEFKDPDEQKEKLVMSAHSNRKKKPETETEKKGN